MLPKTSILFTALLLILVCCHPPVVDTVLKPDLPDTVLVEVIRTDTIEKYVELPKSPGEILVDTLRGYLGVKESPIGSNRGPVVDLFFTGCGVSPGVAWCACFANYGVTHVGYAGPSAPAWSPAWGRSDRIVWLRDKNEASVTFRPGWVFGIYFSRLKRVAHVGVIVEDFGDGYVMTIEGNTNSAGGREGHGVFLKIRHKSEIYFCSDWLNTMYKESS